MKPLNLTDEERKSMVVTYNTNKFCLYLKAAYGYTFLSSYGTKEELQADLDLNRITGVQLDRIATIKSV